MQFEVAAAIAPARNLRELRTHMGWVPVHSFGAPRTGWVPVHSFGGPRTGHTTLFEMEHAREMMLRKDSHLRVVGIGRVLYTVSALRLSWGLADRLDPQGRWVLAESAEGEPGLEFEVVRDVVRM